MPDHNVQALTDSTVVAMPREAVGQLAGKHPAVASAMWYDTLVDASVQREWAVNLGRRSARKRISHLFCEFGVRLQDAGLGSLERYELPMNQDELADALGLTSVHVNRMLMDLKSDGLIEKRRNSVFIDDWNKLAVIGDFGDTYLHVQDEHRVVRRAPG